MRRRGNLRRKQISALSGTLNFENVVGGTMFTKLILLQYLNSIIFTDLALQT